MSTTLNKAAQDALDALEKLRDCAYTLTAGRSPDDDDAAPFDLHWQLGMSADELADQAYQAAAEHTSRNAAFRDGHVYCYACRSADCEHATPQQPDMVFAGYESTGTPEWQEFFNVLLHMGDSRTDRLFAKRPRILSRVVGRQRLTSRQLATFGKHAVTYRIWGQVVAGYLNVGGGRAALTIQVVETRKHRLRFQVVASTELRDALANAPDNRRHAHHRVYDAIAEARHRIDALSAQWQNAPTRKARPKIRDRVFATLRHLAHSIERKGRQGRRRTAHAELRGRQQRPVHKASDDLRKASADDILADTARDSIIVLGKGGRLHAFSRDGRHITSMTVAGDVVARRKKRRRYMALETDARDSFRERALARLSPEDHDKDERTESA